MPTKIVSEATPVVTSRIPEELLHPHHQHMLEVESGISPNVIADRGWRSVDSPVELQEFGFAGYQCRPGLLIPEWTTGGVQRGYKLRPDNPRIGKNGRPIKYEAPAGSRLQLDCPPSMTHALRDTTVTLYVTEGSKKADAAASHGLPCISISGVYGFMRGKLVLDDLDDIALKGMNVRVAFDSDVTTNPKVADALHRLCAALSRRGAVVSVVTFTTGPNGEKIGLDDYFANGGTVAGLDDLTRPWMDRAPLEEPETMPDGDRDAEILRLRKGMERQSRTISALIYIMRDKVLSPTSKVIAVAALTEAHAKRARGEVEPDGRVRLESRYIANDHRQSVPKGTPKPETNKDGSYPLTDRKRVKGILTGLEGPARVMTIEAAETTKTHRATGDRYKDTDLLVTLADDISTDLTRLVAHAIPKTPRKPYTWQEPCQSCGEVHGRTRWTYCDGCGAEYEPPRRLPVPELRLVDDVAAEPDTLAASAFPKNGKAKDDTLSPVPPPTTYLFPKNGEALSISMPADSKGGGMGSKMPPVREGVAVTSGRFSDPPPPAPTLPAPIAGPLQTRVRTGRAPASSAPSVAHGSPASGNLSATGTDSGVRIMRSSPTPPEPTGPPPPTPFPVRTADPIRDGELPPHEPDTDGTGQTRNAPLLPGGRLPLQDDLRARMEAYGFSD